MTNSEIFKKAHQITKQNAQPGDSYAATFSICLRIVYQEQAMNKQALIDQAEAIIKSQSGYSYNSTKLAEIISAGEIPENVCLCSMQGQNFYREGNEIVAKRDGQEIKRTPLDENTRQQVLVMYAAHASKTPR